MYYCEQQKRYLDIGGAEKPEYTCVQCFYSKSLLRDCENIFIKRLLRSFQILLKNSAVGTFFASWNEIYTKFRYLSQTNKILELLEPNIRSSYFLEAIFDGFISLPRIRFGDGPGGGTGGSVRLIFAPACWSRCETPDFFFGICNLLFFAGFGFGITFRFFGMTISSSLTYSSSFSESESWSLKYWRSGSWCFSHWFRGSTFCISKSSFP